MEKLLLMGHLTTAGDGELSRQVRAAGLLRRRSAFAPNHKGMPVLGQDEKTDFLRRQVITSRNVRGGWLTDCALGGLNYQIEHHLFPSNQRHDCDDPAATWAR